MEILYLVLLGIILDRYILPFIDLMFEYISHKVNVSLIDIQLEAKRKQLNFENEFNSDKESIGFDYPISNIEDKYYDDMVDDDEDSNVIVPNKENKCKISKTNNSIIGFNNKINC